ncbi:CBS domain-containing protein [Salsuginibacillus halophilus]|uniref:CBS domain-containing protein n=1 Tax=Salsuginibacillus halophilus TaxID=517424 RepID=A0A2P8HHQ3_9BACI|nr:DUF294 nucleotidyltransferase-like domain-containing protein [Salsuginibacillus halophilus]PSL45762.1 CBS domain-containing protein [Salsuginibacillus halophilus]
MAPINSAYEEMIQNHPMFSGASAAEFRRLYDLCTLTHYKSNAKMLYAQAERDGLLLLLQGVAEVCVQVGETSGGEEVLEVLESGEMIGFSSLADFLGEPNMHETTHTVEVKAVKPVVCLHIPFEVLEARWVDDTVRAYMLRQVAVRLREIYASLAEQVKLANQWGESDAFIRRVQDLMNAPPVMCTEETPVQEAAADMVDAGASSMLVINEAGQITGIITEKDLVARVVSTASTALTAGDVMTPEPHTVHRATYYYEALSTFLTKGVKHLPVTDDGAPAGMLTLSDLLRKKNRGTFDILQEIETADTESLPEVKHAIYGVLTKLIADDIPTLHLLEVVTNLFDRLVRRAVTLALDRLHDAGHGDPPAAFGFYVMGSGARAEQFMLSDQDHFLVYEPVDEAGEAYFAELGGAIVDMLEKAGYKRCDGDMMASFPAWRGSLSRWEERLRGWALRATNDNILLAHNFLSFRFMYGDEALHDQFVQTVEDQLEQARIFLYRAADLEKQTPVPTLDHPIRALFRKKRESIDIKKQALFPLYHSLQLLSVRHNIVEGTPRERIAALQAAGVVTADFADELLFAYETALWVRISQSWSRYQRGEATTSEVHFSEMKTREKEELMIALKSIRSLQNEMLTAFGISG